MKENMPTDETRQLLRTFGVAVTTLEDAVTNRAPAATIEEAERRVRTLLVQLEALIERLGEQVRGDEESKK